VGIIVWNLFPVKLRNHPTVEERSPVLNAGQGRSLRERPSLSCIVLRPAWMVSPGDMLRMLARVRNLVSADQQQDLGPAATFRPGLLQSHLPNSCPGIQELDSVFASTSMAGSATQNVRNLLALGCYNRVFGQPRPSRHWCEYARLRVWFRLSVAYLLVALGPRLVAYIGDG
jgi:hypothetical protein